MRENFIAYNIGMRTKYNVREILTGDCEIRRQTCWKFRNLKQYQKIMICNGLSINTCQTNPIQNIILFILQMQFPNIFTLHTV